MLRERASSMVVLRPGMVGCIAFFEAQGNVRSSWVSWISDGRACVSCAGAVCVIVVSFSYKGRG